MKLKVSGLGFSYEQKKVLSDLSFEVNDGEFVSILGPSGGGKSTVLNLLAGLLTPEAGRIEVDGAEVRGVDNGRFAYMPQNDLLFPWKTILDNVCLYGRIHGGEKQMRERARKLFPAFGLAGYENAYPNDLSGGMRQRAAFLRTAMCSADVMLLDEPFGALDVISRGDMQDWLLSMRSELGRTALLVTHDIEEAVYLSDRVLILGGTPARIVREVDVRMKGKTRDWLYAQGALKSEIHRCIREEGA